MGDEEVPGALVGDRGDLDEFGEAVADLVDCRPLAQGQFHRAGENEKKARLHALGRVRRVVKSRNVTMGAWYAPRRFFNFPWLTATLMLTEASIRPIKVVGMRTKLVERRYEAQAYYPSFKRRSAIRVIVGGMSGRTPQTSVTRPPPMTRTGS